MDFLKSLFAFVIVVGLLLAGASYFYVLQALKIPGGLAVEKAVYIEPGSSTRAIAAALEKEGVIDSPFIFEMGAKLQRGQGHLKAGEYLFPAGISIQDSIVILQSGKTLQRLITIPEGLMAVEIVDLVNAAEAMTGKVETIPDEGSLLPETYSYTHGEDRAKLVERMQKSMNAAKDEAWAKRPEGSLVRTPEEIVTLASVVERETGVAAERAKVAGVFLNRLKLGMPLQSDPTVIYAITEGKAKFDRSLFRKDLEIASPYNTYVNTGLPPGPIANPGRASIMAVVEPEVHDYLYFVADGTGGHAFAASLDDHVRNVAKWRIVQKKARQ